MYSDDTTGRLDAFHCPRLNCYLLLYCLFYILFGQTSQSRATAQLAGFHSAHAQDWPQVIIFGDENFWQLLVVKVAIITRRHLHLVQSGKEIYFCALDLART